MTSQLFDLPESLEHKIEDEATRQGKAFTDLLLILMSVCVLPEMRQSEDPVVRDLSDELKLYILRRAFDIERRSGKTLDMLLTTAGIEKAAGAARIAGSRIKVAQIAAEHARQGMTPEEIAEAHPHLRLSQIYAALAYYDEHPGEIVAEIDATLAETDRLRAEAGESPFAARMRAEGRLPPKGDDAQGRAA